MRTLMLKATYKDTKNSIQDEGNEAANARTLAPLTLFFETLNRAVDAPGASPRNPETNCAFQLYNQWAAAGALTYEPEVYDSGGKVTRGLRSSAFQILGLKFRSAGYSLSNTVLTWLQKMDSENVEFYAKGSNRGNQRVWAATGAALNNLIIVDQASMRFQDQVWHEAIEAIRDDGFIDAELSRGRMALAYHMYSLSATLILEAARSALGYTELHQEKYKIKLLEDAIGRSLCNPSQMERLAGAKIAIPGAWAYGIINGFARTNGDLGPDWSKCALPPTDYRSRDYGGDTRHTAKMLADMASKVQTK